LACRSLDLKKNDIFWTVPNTYAATANAGLLCGAKIDFVDIDQFTNNINLKLLKEKLKIAKKKKILQYILQDYRVIKRKYLNYQKNIILKLLRMHPIH
jgi:dTDP-4-amino-4,6-dideoxygalactose transaminase